MITDFIKEVESFYKRIYDTDLKSLSLKILREYSLCSKMHLKVISFRCTFYLFIATFSNITTA